MKARQKGLPPTSGGFSRWLPLLFLLVGMLLLPPGGLSPSHSTLAQPVYPGGVAASGSSHVIRPVSSPEPVISLPSTARPTIQPPSDGWLLYQGGGLRDGWSADSPPQTTQLAWSAHLPTPPAGTTTISGGIVTSGGVVYVPSSSRAVVALNGTTGAILWSYATNGSVAAAPALDQGMLIFADQAGKLYVLNSTTGGQIVVIPLGLPDNGASPLPVGSAVLAPCLANRHNSLCKFSLPSGTEVWNQSVGSFLSSPSIDPVLDMVYVSNTSGGVLGMSFSTGKVAWNYSFGPTLPITSSPVISPSRELVYAFASQASTSGGDLAAFNETLNGSLFMKHPRFEDFLGFGVSSAAPVLSSNALLMATELGTVYAVNPSNGSYLWEVHPWAGNTNEICASPLVANNALLVDIPGSSSCGSGGSQLFELSTVDGHTLSHISIVNGSVDAGLAITNTAVYLGANDGTVLAVGIDPPSAPRNLAVTPANTSLDLSWSPPASDGGQALSQYAISWGVSPSGQLLSTTVSNTTLSHLITGLTDGLPYVVIVEAVNGQGPSTEASLVATPGSVPWPPQGVKDVLAQDSFSLLWSPPAENGGFAVTSYVVHWWNASKWQHHNTTLSATATSWTQTGIPDGVEVFAQVAAVNSWNRGNYSGVVEGAPYLAPGVLTLVVNPASVRPNIHLTVQGVAVTVPVGNGTASSPYLPGTYWVNASASGYQIFDKAVTVSSAKTTVVYVNLTVAPRNPFSLSTLQIAVISAVAVVAIILGLLVIGTRYRRLRAIAEPEEEEEGGGEGGISESRARAILQPATPAEGEEAPALPEPGYAEEAPAAPPEPQPEAPEEEPEGTGGRLGDYFARRRAEKETLKNSEKNTPEE
ncbi:MAG: PQQ-binding-like beta-propeller repeat protein [Euryarchaeota archaeon]|nr:PQQ-binding-like beta-propeller repeat protein [Euryarchaeota archaeon]MDE1837000.1 PQQ-binding-like beta-propeller repeat protein [Euryarchaeota archaeon]MDE1881922.1 PQQ-binding-like beta-propeller repeat protein [Euryarchaeota archaeon]MDE2045658.1 PQQ-binding-like beta-propeller repeat protein [Thermoplasmata archaeon]